MKPTLFLIWPFSPPRYLAQKNGTVKGIAYDTLGKKTVSSVTVTVLDKKDFFAGFISMTDNSGILNCAAIPNGELQG
jgi:hypothetical protein